MRVVSVREHDSYEPRCAVTPDSVRALQKLGLTVRVETGVGARAHFPDAAYRDAGAEVSDDRAGLLSEAEVVLGVRAPSGADAEAMKRGAVWAGFLDPLRAGTEAVRTLAARGVTGVSMELMPRTTIAQKMDALSSQHSLAGYYMVVLAAERLGKALPMMSTPAGTIQPARVFVIGAGVAGLQAIATARRLGARVEAFDTRPVVKEQVESLGARFLEIDLGQTGEAEQGYARELTPEQQQLQREGMAKAVAQSDVVITTAQLFGREAPVVVTRDMLARMRPGAVVMDYAVESGGNVEGSGEAFAERWAEGDAARGDELPVEVDNEHGAGEVRVIGVRNYPGRIARDASRVYASNLAALVGHLCQAPQATGSADGGSPGGTPSGARLAVETRLGAEDEIATGCVVTHEGSIVNARVRQALGNGG